MEDPTASDPTIDVDRLADVVVGIGDPSAQLLGELAIATDSDPLAILRRIVEVATPDEQP